MEWDFLGIAGNNSGNSVEEESRSGHMDSAANWPFSHLMTFENPKEVKSQLLFDPLPSSIFESNQKANGVEDQQHYLGTGVHCVSQVPIYAYQKHAMEAGFGTSSYLKSHGSSNGSNHTVCTMKQQNYGSATSNSNPAVKPWVGTLVPRNASKPSTRNAQLTIFYAGSVIVYDEVPWEKAQEIMLMASKESRAATNAVLQRVETPGLPLTKGLVSDSLKYNQTLNKYTNHLATCSGPVLISDDKSRANISGTQMSTSQDEPSKTMNVSAAAGTIMSRGVPQARKASLARFLEKRKERYINFWGTNMNNSVTPVAEEGGE
ncbi:Protein TIFY 6A [Apostasia shenzhenica]|uniref:Protein TIFY n=1 Tax=Apostasia shenzhenica TaxID=1088818 RepID=A0A2I0AZQ1_9ASPA|nr:Protein TIFY 6A [Apostasia shenzhenica]